MPHKTKWVLHPDGDLITGTMDAKYKTDNIASITKRKDQRKNARLIACAPELLEELVHALACLMGDEDPRYAEINAVIERAKNGPAS